MPEKTNAGTQNNDFEQSMSALSDDQLKEVLKKRSLYQEEAVKIAIQEAKKRGIIRSEEELPAPRFRHEPMKRA
jgi:hypothetical protein